MNSTCFLIIGYSNEIPNEVTDHEMIMLSEGFSDQELAEEVVATENFSYMTTFSHKSVDLEFAFKEIQSSWFEQTKSTIDLKLITDDTRNC